MSDWTMQSTERDPRRLFGAYTRRHSTCAKDLARKIGCDHRTAEGYRAGRYWPQARHWVGIVAAFGDDVTEAVFHPERAAARLAREVRDLEEALAEKRAALRHVQSDCPGVAQALARAEDRAAAILKRGRP